ncbi:MAG: FAD-binding oxidoreductase, partial [Pseudonocardiaceae bacterium]
MLGPVDDHVLGSSLRAAVRGEVRTDAGTRALYATDASNYRVPPRAVVLPRCVDDVSAVIAFCREQGVPLTARGAGTSIAGNAIGPGVILDFSRHLDAVLELDPSARLARAQPGVVLDTLQAAAAPHGLRFGPDPSSHSRCTLGGMIGNNACGTHSIAWGTTAQNVEELVVLL